MPDEAAIKPATVEAEAAKRQKRLDLRKYRRTAEYRENVIEKRRAWAIDGVSRTLTRAAPLLDSVVVIRRIVESLRSALTALSIKDLSNIAESEDLKEALTVSSEVHAAIVRIRKGKK